MRRINLARYRIEKARENLQENENGVRKKAGSLKKIIRPPYFVPADKRIDAQLRSFQTRKLHQAVVLDGTGRVAGLVTLEDILEELVGSIKDEHDLE